MADASQKVIQHLNVAHATELALVQTLTAHIAITPRGSYRSALEQHLEETKAHSERVQARLDELGETRSIVQSTVGLVEAAMGQALAFSKAPIDMLRGTSAEEKLLRNARDECATEGLEVGIYTELEHIARAVGDEVTADMAASICEDEERMLVRLRAEIPRLAEAVVRAELGGVPAYDPTSTGAADAARVAGRAGKAAAQEAGGRAKAAARQARKVPGVTQAEGEVKGTVASEEDLPIAGYDSKNASQITSELSGLSQIDLGKVDAYERLHENRTTVLQKIDSLRGDEPWPGYDELTVDDITTALGVDGDHVADADKVRDYERRHKNRAGVLEAAERERAGAS
jgi:ferritin-like metal-binding protein YciE